MAATWWRHNMQIRLVNLFPSQTLGHTEVYSHLHHNFVSNHFQAAAFWNININTSYFWGKSRAPKGLIEIIDKMINRNGE